MRSQCSFPHTHTHTHTLRWPHNRAPTTLEVSEARGSAKLRPPQSCFLSSKLWCIHNDPLQFDLYVGHLEVRQLLWNRATSGHNLNPARKRLLSKHFVMVFIRSIKANDGRALVCHVSSRQCFFFFKVLKIFRTPIFAFTCSTISHFCYTYVKLGESQETRKMVKIWLRYPDSQNEEAYSSHNATHQSDDLMLSSVLFFQTFESLF